MKISDGGYGGVVSVGVSDGVGGVSDGVAVAQVASATDAADLSKVIENSP